MKNNSPLKIAVLVSGSGSNLQALIDKQLNQSLNINIVGVISNKSDAYALTRATSANIPTAIIDKDDNGKQYTRIGFENQALEILKAWQPDLVVLAGFMRILTPLFIDGVTVGMAIPMINLHPSLLPSYKGLNTHARVLQSGERQHGCSVHLVTQALDAGAVLAQAIVSAHVNDTPEQLAQRVHQSEHQLLPLVVDLFVKQLITIKDGKPNTALPLALPLKLVLD